MRSVPLYVSACLRLLPCPSRDGGSAGQNGLAFAGVPVLMNGVGAFMATAEF